MMMIFQIEATGGGNSLKLMIRKTVSEKTP